MRKEAKGDPCKQRAKAKTKVWQKRVMKATLFDKRDKGVEKELGVGSKWFAPRRVPQGPARKTYVGQTGEGHGSLGGEKQGIETHK